MRRKSPVVVLTSKIVFNTRKFTVNVNDHPELLFLNGKKRAKEDFFIIIIIIIILFLGIPGLHLRRGMET